MAAQRGLYLFYQFACDFPLTRPAAVQYRISMRKRAFFPVIAMVAICSLASAQMKRTEVPIGDAVQKALAKGSLTGEGARPFHIRVIVNEPENPQSPYQGTIEEWWNSNDQWRREVTAKEGMHQIIVMASGQKTEKDDGDYFPLWLNEFVTAIFDPVPNAKAWEGTGATIEQITIPNGLKSDACARAQSKLGTGERATDAFSNVCFDDQGRLKFVGSPAYSMEFHDYRGFGKKQIARKLVDDPESGTTLVGEVAVLEDEEKVKDAANLFAPLATADDKFHLYHVSSDMLEKMSTGAPPIVWPTVHSGNTRGHLAIYICVDTQGHVREAWPLNSDNAGLEDSVRCSRQHRSFYPGGWRPGVPV